MSRAAKWGIGIAVLLLLAFVGLCSAIAYLAIEGKRGRQLLDRGYAELRKGHYDAATSKLTEALHHRLDNVRKSYAYGNRAYCFEQKEQADEALRDYDEAIRLNPRLGWAFEARAALHSHKGETEQALHDYSRAIELDPNNAEALKRRARIYLSQHKNEEAIADLREAIRAQPDTASFYISLGDAYLANDNLPAAIASFDSAIRLGPRNSRAFRKRAKAYAQFGDVAKASADTSRAEELLRANTPAARSSVDGDLASRADAAYRGGDYAEAIQLYTELLGTKLGKNAAAAAFISRGNAHLHRNEVDEAVKDYQSVLQEQPDDADAFAHLAGADLRKRDYTAAIANCTRAIELDPKLIAGYITCAESHYRNAQSAEALADLKRAIEAKGAHPEQAYNELAWLRATAPDDAMRDGKEAVAAATRACALTRWQDPGLLDTLAAAYAESGAFDKAVDLQTQALALDKDASQVHAEMEERLGLYRKGEPFRDTRPR